MRDLSGGGHFVAVVGASGAGKDTVMGWARERLMAQPRIRFLRRVITRRPDASSEDHDVLTTAEFDAMAASGAFGVTWHAHGLHYGIRAEDFAFVRQGGIAVCNVSRASLERLLATGLRVTIVEITVDPAIRETRLRARGRETPAEVDLRLSRRLEAWPGSDRAIRIDNSGPLDAAGGRLTELLAGLAVDTVGRVTSAFWK